MAIYQYQSGSIIDEVRILTNETGGKRAYLHASATASPTELQAIYGNLNNRGWRLVPTEQDGKPVMEVRGFKKVEDVLGLMGSQGWAKGTPSLTPQSTDEISSRQKMRNRTLRTAGWVYIFGDTTYIVYAFKKFFHEKHELNKTTNFFNRMDIVGGFGYILGSAALALYGSRDQSQNTIQAASRKIRSYLHREGITDVNDIVLGQTAAPPQLGFFGKLDHTFGKYPSETLNSIYVGVGGALSSAAIYRAIKAHAAGHFRDRNTELIDVGLGAITATSAIAGLTIKEKKPEEGMPRAQTIPGKVWEWIQEKPLRATGYGYMVATLFHAGASVKKWQQGDVLTRKTVIWRICFVAANIVSELLLALSSKGHGTGVKPDGSIDQTVLAATAELISRQPPEKQEALVQQLAGYISSVDVLGGKADEHAAELRRQLDALKNNPWIAKPVATASAPALPAPKAEPQTRISQASREAALVEKAPQLEMAH